MRSGSFIEFRNYGDGALNQPCLTAFLSRRNESVECTVTVIPCHRNPQTSGAPNPTPKLITARLPQAGQRSDSVPARTHMYRYTGTERTYTNRGLRWHTALE